MNGGDAAQRRRGGARGPILAAAFALLCAAIEAGDAGPPAPAFEARKHQSDYAGPGREDPAPAGLTEVLIGYFGPSDSSHAGGGDLYRAASMAIEEANAGGGYQGLPFRLVAGWSENPWGSGVAQVTRMAYVDKVWAIVGSIDGPATHLAEQVVVKARLTLISPGSTDSSVNLANVPWMFTCLPGDHLAAPVLAGAVERFDSFVILSSNDHDSHHFVRGVSASLAKRGRAPRYHYEFDGNALDTKALTEHALAANVQAIVLVAGPHPSARLIKALRGGGFTGALLGGPSLGRRRFLQEAGPLAEGVILPFLSRHQEGGEGFTRAFTARAGHPPDFAAAAAYDAVRLLVDAIRTAGLNRARIRDAVRDLSPWRGAGGMIQWDPLGSNARPVRLGTIRSGRLIPLDQK